MGTKLWKRIFLALDRLFENFALFAIFAMTLIVIVQVFTRKLFNFVFFWSEEITLLLFVWFSFMGIAVGFREKLHISMNSLTRRFSRRFNAWLDIVIGVSMFAFGLYLIGYGWNFTLLMHESTLPATKLPSSVLYAVMPVTGIMICVVAFLQLIGKETRRHRGFDEEERE